MAGGICFLFFFEILDKPRVIYYFAWFVNTKSLLPSSVYWIYCQFDSFGLEETFLFLFLFPKTLWLIALEQCV